MIHRHRFSLFCSVLSLASLVACGGGGGGAGGVRAPGLDGGSVGQLLSGQVIDGYLEGATVCLDLDHSGRCDPAEPSTVTGERGRYALSTEGLSVSEQVLLVEVPASARDSDHGGLTLAKAGYQGYTLAARVERSAHITPLSTMVVGKLKAGLARDLDAAEQAVIRDLQLPADTDLGQSPLSRPDLRAKARRIARQLQADPNLTPSERWAQVSRRLPEHHRFSPLFGDLLGTDSLPAPAAAQLAPIGHLGQGWLLTYALPRTRDGQDTQATAMLLTPGHTAPAGGWPLVVLAAGSASVAGSCAPSLGGLDAAQLVWIEQLLAHRMAVVIPDLEGRGPGHLNARDAHPLLHLQSTGRAMALAALAARHQLGARLSGAWAVMGQAHAGHAALAAAQYSGLATDMHYRGAVALAPHSGFLARMRKVLTNAAQARYGQTHDVYTALAQTGSLATAMVQGSAATDTPLDPAAVLRTGLPDAPRMPQVLGLREIHERSRALCQDTLPRLVDEDVNHYAFRNMGPVDYPGIHAQALSEAPVAAYFNANEPGMVRLPGRTLLLQGQSDTTVHPASTEQLLERMQRLGSEVELLRYGGTTHAGLSSDPQVRADALKFLEQRLAR